MHTRFLLPIAFVAGLVVAPLLQPTAVVGGPPPADFASLIARADPSVAHVTTVLEGGRAPGSRDDAVGAGFVFGAISALHDPDYPVSAEAVTEAVGPAPRRRRTTARRSTAKEAVRGCCSGTCARAPSPHRCPG